MGPEQLEGGIIDRRVDVFTTGIVLWELLVGKKLMAAESTAKTLMRLLKEPVPRVSDIVTDIDPKLDRIVARALERDPAPRFQPAGEMRDALEQYLVEGRHLAVHEQPMLAGLISADPAAGGIRLPTVVVAAIVAVSVAIVFTLVERARTAPSIAPSPAPAPAALAPAAPRPALPPAVEGPEPTPAEPVRADPAPPPAATRSIQGVPAWRPGRPQLAERSEERRVGKECRS